MINLMALHNQRFFSYLSLFTFFMLILVSGANYFVMFVGWEGMLQCLKWVSLNLISWLRLVQVLYSFFLPPASMPNSFFHIFFP